MLLGRVALGVVVRSFSLVVVVALTACCGFKSTGDGDMGTSGGGADGGGGTGGTGGDGGGGGNSAVDDMGTAASGCGVGAPVLLVAMQSVDGSRQTDGSVLQYALTGTGVTPCGPELNAANTLSKSPNSVAWIPPNSVAYGATDSIVLLDSATDQLRWTYRPTQYGDVPLNVFPLSHAGALAIGIGYDTHGGQVVDTLALIDGKTGMQLNWLDVQSSTSKISLGSSVQATVQDPRDATKIVYVDNGGSSPRPLVEVDVPWDGNTVTPTTYYGQKPPGPTITTLNAVRVGNLNRFVWLQSTTSTTTGDIAYEIDDDGSGPQPYGPLTCSNPKCVSPFKANDAVPDPTKPGRVLTTCSAANNGTALSNVRHVVRIDGAQCDILIDGTTVRNLTFPAALAVGAAQ